MIGVHTGLELCTPCCRTSLHAGLHKQWDVMLLPYDRLTNSGQASLVSSLLWVELGLSFLLSLRLYFPFSLLHVAPGVH